MIECSANTQSVGTGLVQGGLTGELTAVPSFVPPVPLTVVPSRQD